MTETVAVIVPTIPGREQVLARALQSIADQTRLADQVVVEPDNDRTGAAATRNRALEEVTCEWTAFLDDDDTWYPQHLERLLATASATDADLVYPWFDGINAAGVLATMWGGEQVTPFRVPFGAEQREQLLTVANFIPVTVLVRTGLLRAVGGFSPPPWQTPDNPCEDWGAWVKLLHAGARFVHLPEVTWTWRSDVPHTSGAAIIG